jgi:hypothetical protein
MFCSCKRDFLRGKAAHGGASRYCLLLPLLDRNFKLGFLSKRQREPFVVQKCCCSLRPTLLINMTLDEESMTEPDLTKLEIVAVNLKAEAA